MSKKRDLEPQEEGAFTAPVIEEAPAITEGPIPGTVRLMNMNSQAKDITLYDGTNVKLHPFNRTGSAHISRPIPKKLLPEVVRKMAQRRELAILEEVK